MKTGVITVGDISGETTQSLKAVEVSNPYYGYSVGTEYSVNTVHDNTKITNHQKLVKLSGYDG